MESTVGGEVVIDLEGTTESTFAWILGNSSNNQAEAYALPQGLCIANDSRIKLLIVVGDSHAIINQMILKSSPADNNLTPILARAHQEANKFNKITF